MGNNLTTCTRSAENWGYELVLFKNQILLDDGGLIYIHLTMHTIKNTFIIRCINILSILLKFLSTSSEHHGYLL